MLFNNAVPDAGVSRVKQDERNHFDVPSKRSCGGRDKHEVKIVLTLKFKIIQHLQI
jgi:hypothetical protein